MSNSHILTALFIGGGVGVVAKLSASIWQIAGGILLLIGLSIAILGDLKKDDKKKEKDIYAEILVEEIKNDN